MAKFCEQFMLPSIKTNYSFLFAFAFSLCSIFTYQAQAIKPNKDNSNTQNPEPIQCPADLRLISVPEGFISSTSFNGYIHLNSATSIVMTSIEHLNFLRLCAGMTPEFFAQNGLKLIEEKEFTSENNVPGRYYKASFVIDEVPHIRYMVFSGDLNRSLWLNITFPSMFETLVDKEIKGIINSIKSKVSDDK